jgi:transposase
MDGRFEDSGMSKTYRAWNPEQTWLLPPSPRDWLPEGDLVYFLLDIVGSLDISAITEKYEREDRGYPPYHPRMMTALLLYSYTQGVFSSRRIMRRCERDAAWRVIVQDDVPNFRTISDFRKLHLKELEELYVQVLRLCQEAGLVKLDHIALDGTKIKANASRHKAMSYGRMKAEEQRLRKEIRGLLQRAESTDAQEDQEHGFERRGDELPEELARRESRLRKIRDARKALENQALAAAQEERNRRAEAQAAACEASRGGRKPAAVKDVPDDKAQYNFTDPETKIMKASNKGFDQCGNAQAVVDREHQIILAADVTNEANDKKQFQPMLAQAKKNVGRGRRIRRASSDAGYFSEDNVKWAENHKLDSYIATGRIKHHDKIPSSPRGRPPTSLTMRERMARKLRTKKGRETYAQRKWIVEPVFGFIKRGLGFTQFLLNGLQKMRGEWRLICMACNLRKLWAAG